jgi:hypothetical protein
MTELEHVKQQSYDYLFLQLGYSHEEAKKTVESYIRVTGYYHGKPSKVLTKTANGEEVEIYL